MNTNSQSVELSTKNFEKLSLVEEQTGNVAQVWKLFDPDDDDFFRIIFAPKHIYVQGQRVDNTLWFQEEENPFIKLMQESAFISKPYIIKHIVGAEASFSWPKAANFLRKLMEQKKISEKNIRNILKRSYYNYDFHKKMSIDELLECEDIEYDTDLELFIKHSKKETSCLDCADYMVDYPENCYWTFELLKRFYDLFSERQTNAKQV